MKRRLPRVGVAKTWQKIRIHPKLADVLLVIAAREGVTATAVLNRILAEHAGLPVSKTIPGDEETPAGSGVYFAQIDPPAGLVKIGFSLHVSRRLRELRSAGVPPFRLLLFLRSEAPRKLELEMQRRFEKLRVGGEWFRFGQELSEFVEEEKRAHGAQ